MYPHKNTMMNIKLYKLSNMILKTNWLIHFKSCFGKETEIDGVVVIYRKQVGESDLGSKGGLHTAAEMGEGGNVICRGLEVKREVLTHFLFLLLGWQNSSPSSLEFTSIPSSHTHSFMPSPVFSFFLVHFRVAGFSFRCFHQTMMQGNGRGEAGDGQGSKAPSFSEMCSVQDGLMTV